MSGPQNPRDPLAKKLTASFGSGPQSPQDPPGKLSQLAASGAGDEGALMDGDAQSGLEPFMPVEPVD
jgi:hypothetical protein